MGKAKEFMGNIPNTFNAWFKERFVRRVFVIMLLLSIGLFAFSQFDVISYLNKVAMVTLIIAVFASLIDTWISRSLFKAMVLRVEQEHKIREVETHGSVQTPTPFESEDVHEIRARMSGYLGIMILKIVIIAGLILLASGSYV